MICQRRLHRGNYAILPNGRLVFVFRSLPNPPRPPSFPQPLQPYPHLPRLPNHGGGQHPTAPQGNNPAHIPPNRAGNQSNNQHKHADLPYNQIAEAGAKAYKLFKDRGHFAHDLSKLVEHACENLESKKMSKYQAQGFGSLQKSMHPGGPKNGSTFKSSSGLELSKDWSATDETVIKKFWKQFDQLFFFGTLDSRCYWEIDWNAHPNILGLCTTTEQYGYNTQVGGSSPHARARIQLSKLHGVNREKRLVEYIGTLLHEMCHAFMTVWCCEARSCFQRSDCCGVTGHGDAWQDASLTVEQAAKKHLKLNLDLGRMDSYALELVATGVAPSKHCSRWGFDVPKLNQMVALIKQRR